MKTIMFNAGFIAMLSLTVLENLPNAVVIELVALSAVLMLGSKLY